MKTFLACLVSAFAATGANYFLFKQDLAANDRPDDRVVAQAAGNADAAQGSKRQPGAGNAQPGGQQYEEILAELKSINEELERIGEFILLARGDTIRVYHYVAGHKSYSKRTASGQLFCAECGLIADLENRQTVLDGKTAKLSARLSQLKKAKQTDTKEFKDGIAELQRINTELELLQKHLFAGADMEKKLSTTTNTPAEYPKSVKPAPVDLEKEHEEKPANDKEQKDEKKSGP